MKKFLHLLTLFCLLVATAATARGEDIVAYECKFGRDYNSKGISSYTDSWQATNDSFTWDIVNFNNNNTSKGSTNSWDYVKCGSNKAASVATITTASAMPKKITKVTLNIGAITVASINSIKLKTSSTNNFDSPIETLTFTQAKGEQTVTLLKPAADLYYQLEVDCAQASSNGPLQVNDIKYYTDGSDSNPVIPSEITFTPEGGKIDTNTLISISADGSPAPTIQYSIDGAAVKTYSEPFTLSVGDHTITATATNSAGSKTASATFTVTKAAEISKVTFDFSKPSDYCDSKYEFKSNAGTVVDYFSNGNVQVNVTQANGTGKDQELRFYNIKEFRTSANGGKLGHSFTVSTIDGSNITSIVFTNTALNMSADSGSLENGTWTGSESSVTFTTSGQVVITLMDVTYEAGAPKAKLTFDKTECTAYLKENFPSPELSVDPEEAASLVKYSSSNPEVATVDDQGTITLLSTGETEIKAYIKDSDDYQDSETSYQLTVKPARTTYRGPRSSDLKMRVGDSDCLIYSAAHPENLTYSVTTPGIVSIDDNYVVKALAEGETVVNWSWPGDDTYKPGESSFNVTISPKDESVHESPVTFSFGGSNFGLTRYHDGYPSMEDGSVASQNPIDITFYGSQNALWGSGIRVGGNFTISAPLGYAITNIDIEYASATAAGNFKLADGQAGTWTKEEDHTYWTGENQFVSIVNNSTSIYVIEVIKVTYTEANPAVPVVTIGDEVLVNGGSKTVREGTEISISCENAASLKGTYTYTDSESPSAILNAQVLPLEYKIMGSGTLEIHGVNGSRTGEDFVYTFVMAEDKLFSQISSTNDLEEDTYYVIAATNGANAMSTNVVQNKFGLSPIEPDNKSIVISTADVLVVQLKKQDEENWAILTTNFSGKDGYLLPSGNTNTDLTVSDEVSLFTIAFNQSGNANIGSNGRYINNSGNYFGMYTSSSSSLPAVQLYKESLPGKPVLMIGDRVLEGDELEVAEGTEVTVVCPNADVITGFIGKDNFIENEPLPYRFTVNEETLVYLIGYNRIGNEGEELEFTFTIGESSELHKDMPKVGARYKQLLKGDELKEGYYIIARASDNVALGVNGTDSNISATDGFKVDEVVPVWRRTDNSPYQTKDMNVLKTTEGDVLVVYLTKQGDQFGLQTVNYGDGLAKTQGWLANPSGSNLTVVPEFTPVNVSFSNYNNAAITFGAQTTDSSDSSEDSDDTNSETTTTYQIKYDPSNKRFNYQSNGRVVQLYKYTEAHRFIPEIDEPFSLPMSQKETQYHDAVESSKEIIIKNEEKPNNLEFIVKGTTSTVIWLRQNDNGIWEVVANDNRPSERPSVMIEWEETADWFSGIYELPVTVKYYLDDNEFGFRHSVIRGKEGVGVAAQAAYYIGTGNVTYKVYDTYDETDLTKNEPTTDVNINENTGMIRPEDLTGAIIDKKYIVEAYVGETDTHMDGRRTYIFWIEAPDEAEESTNAASFDFTVKDAYNMYEFNDENTSTGTLQTIYELDFPISGYNHEPITEVTEGDVTMKFEGKYRFFKNNSGNYQVRIYKANNADKPAVYPNQITGKFTLVSNQDSKIRAVVIDGNSAAVSNNFKTDVTGTWDDRVKWVAPSNGVSSVSFTVDANIQINNLTVILDSPSVTSDPACALSFDVSAEGVERYINTFAGEVVELPELLHAEGLPFTEVELDIDEIDELDETESFQNYSFAGTTDYNNICVQVNDPGIYTFRAKYDPESETVNHGDKKFLKGMAILRLNVFPRLSVLPTEDYAISKEDIYYDPRTERADLTLVMPDSESSTTMATVKLPSIEDLKNAYKYSTIKITKVTICEKNEMGEYKEPDTFEGDDLNLLDITHNFARDGYVEYTVRYADTEDFYVTSKVHVVSMPLIPEASLSDRTISLHKQNGELLEYIVFEANNKDVAENVPEDPASYFDAQKRQNAPRRVAALNTWQYADDSVAIELPDDGNAYGVKYRTIKDITNIVEGDGTLGSPFMISTIDATSGGMLTEIDTVITEDFDADALYFDLNGFKVDRPEKGVIYIKVKGDKSIKVIL